MWWTACNKTVKRAPASYLIGVLSREVFHWWNDSLSNQLTVRGRGLLLDQFSLLPSDWCEHAEKTRERYTEILIRKLDIVVESLYLEKSPDII